MLHVTQPVGRLRLPNRKRRKDTRRALNDDSIVVIADRNNRQIHSLRLVEWTLDDPHFKYILEGEDGTEYRGVGERPLLIGEVAVTAPFPIQIIGPRSPGKPQLRPVFTFNLPDGLEAHHLAYYHKLTSNK